MDLRHLLAIILLASPLPAAAQPAGLPFTVAIVDWDAGARERQGRAYRAEHADREVLYCVTSYATRAATANVDMLVVSEVRRDEPGRAHKVADVGERCLAPDGKPLPTIHTHSDGNCQFSPADLITIAVRNAPFDGVQCGEHHFIWAFAWQVRAIVAAAEQERLARGSQ